MVLKKLGHELREEFLEVIDYLGRHEGMQVLRIGWPPVCALVNSDAGSSVPHLPHYSVESIATICNAGSWAEWWLRWW